MTLSILLLTQVSATASKKAKGNGYVTKELRKIDSFSKIKASSGLNIILFQGEEEKIIVETDENLLNLIKTTIEGETLKCFIDDQIKFATKMNVYVYYKNVNSIKASSGADVDSDLILKGTTMKLKSSSGADIKLKLKVNNLTCDASSGAVIKVEGWADEIDAEASSGADVKAKDMKVKYAKAEASSAGTIVVSPSEKIIATASSSGDIIYYGNISDISISESSGGDVRKKE